MYKAMAIDIVKYNTNELLLLLTVSNSISLKTLIHLKYFIKEVEKMFLRIHIQELKLLHPLIILFQIVL